MNIVYFYQYFGTPKGGWSTRVYEMTRRWVAAGHHVTVVTSLYDKSDLEADGFITRFDIDGVQVILVNVKLSNDHGFAARIASFLLYALVSVYYALRLPFDVCIASSGPITVGLSGLVAKFVRRKPFVFEIRDIWPDGAVQLGVLKNPSVISAARWFEKLCYRAADLVVACSPGQAAHVSATFPDKKVLVVSNASDNDLMDGVDAAVLKRPAYLKDKKLVVYTGTLGLMDDCTQIVEAARVLQKRGREDIALLFIGSGNEKTALEARAERYGLRNLHFLGLMPKEQVVAWLKNARAAFYTVKDVPVLHTGSPNKLFDAFAAGVPVVQTSRGWIWDLLEQENCGLNAPLDDADATADAVTRLCDDEALFVTCAANAKRLAQTRFDRGHLAATYLAALQDLATPTKAGTYVLGHGD